MSGKLFLLQVPQGLFCVFSHNSVRHATTPWADACATLPAPLNYPGAWTVLQVVCSGFFNSLGLYEACSAERRRKAREWLRLLELEREADRLFDELSFGRQRLVLLARAAVKAPRLLLLDEPCQGLDAGQRENLLQAVDALVTRTGATLVFVTHHPRELPACISHVLRVERGRGLRVQWQV
ncbi:MAG TPA: ATP-binding cassette domain-containing protein [Clostridia bacterium]|nr:ATP-binding cassette domain-containing protein [Clostridia bacterium]